MKFSFSPLLKRVASLGPRVAYLFAVVFYVFLLSYGGYLAYDYFVRPLPPLAQQAPPPTLKQAVIDQALSPEHPEIPSVPETLASPLDPTPGEKPVETNTTPRPQ